MNEVEFIQSLIGFAISSGPWGVYASLLLGMYKLWDKLAKLQENFNALNHSSTTVVKALIKKKIIDSDDIKDVQI